MHFWCWKLTVHPALKVHDLAVGYMDFETIHTADAQLFTNLW